MKELEYPFDADYILSHKKKIKRELLEEKAGTSLLHKKIAILGGSTTNDIRLILELFLLNYGIEAEFYESEYNQYYQDAMFPGEELTAFSPDVIYIHTTSKNIVNLPTPGMPREEADRLLVDEMERFTGMWAHLLQTFHCPIIQNNFELPSYRLLGNRDCVDAGGMVNFIMQLNMRFSAYAARHENFYINDINYLSAAYGLEKWADPLYWHMYKYACTVSAIPDLAFNIAKIIKAIFGCNKKGLVLDLDNTLWGGVVGDDGVDGIEIGQETPLGQAYLEFQHYIKQQKDLGILLNVDSKNDEENALAGLQHPAGLLRPDDFIEIYANWDPKDANFRQIAEDLHLLPESLVFVDDNPAERAIVCAQVPGVSAPAFEQIEDAVRVIDRSGFFENIGLSADDKERNAMYQANAKREKLQQTFASYEEYLTSLEMKGRIRPFEEPYMARIAQLTNKSNQFNLTTRRYTQAEIEEAAADEKYITRYGALTDRFGDNGIVSVVIGEVKGEELDIILWLMSCRVLKRDMECAMMDALVQAAKERGVKRINGFYFPTAKNAMVREFYAQRGFSKVREEEDGATVWCLETDSYAPQNHVIEVED